MWAKILAGAVAAVAVAGTGTFFAMHGTGHCPFSGSCDSQPIASDSDSCSCCLMAPCPGDAASPDAMAACVGPSAFLPTAASQKSVGACCTE